MAEAKCPGTCGELLQGWLLGSEKLVSCPINMYSTVSVTNGVQHQTVMPLIEAAIQQSLNFFHFPDDYRYQLAVEHSSELPIAKGYASSTADICATVMAISRHFNKEISPDDIAKIASTLDPCDSTMFKGLALLDHNNGTLIKRYSSSYLPSVFILENEQTLLTKDFHRINRHQNLLNSESNMHRAFCTFKQGIVSNNPTLLGLASTMSAKENQHIRQTPLFDMILRIAENHQLYGVCLAHSGSIVGLLYDENSHDIDKVITELHHSHCFSVYNKQRKAQIIGGGII